MSKAMAETTHDPPERVQKILARAGFGARRKCEDLIRQGRVEINGRTAVLGDRATGSDRVAVDDVVVRLPDRTVVYLLNKPRGRVTTASDPQGRPTVMELVPAEPRVFAIGRLDKDTEGLLLLTNDGDFAQLVAHPRHRLVKTYVATVKGKVSGSTLRKLESGVALDDGPASANKARILAGRGSHTLVELEISMGRNRIVRRMLATAGHPVERLVRTAIGPLRDERLAPGKWRRLSTAEIAALEAAASK